MFLKKVRMFLKCTWIVLELFWKFQEHSDFFQEQVLQTKYTVHLKLFHLCRFQYLSVSKKNFEVRNSRKFPEQTWKNSFFKNNSRFLSRNSRTAGHTVFQPSNLPLNKSFSINFSNESLICLGRTECWSPYCHANSIIFSRIIGSLGSRTGVL